MHQQRNRSTFRERSCSTIGICFRVVLLVALVCSCISFLEKCGKANKSSRKCAGRKYILSEDLARAAEWAKQSFVAIGTKYEGSRSNNRCLVSGENHSRGLRKERILARRVCCPRCRRSTLYYGYKPGTRWCYGGLHQSGRRNKVRVAILSKSHHGTGHLIRLR